MRKKPIKYYFKFYFWAVVFFLEAVFYWIINKKPIAVPVASTGVNLLDEDPAILMPKPSTADAVKNKAKLGLATMTPKKKRQLFIGLTTLTYLLFMGAGNTIYWLVVLIKMYPWLVGFLLYNTSLIISYFIIKLIYKYFKTNKHKEHLIKIQSLWSEAKLKSVTKIGFIIN